MKATITLPNGNAAEIELSCEQQEQINKLCKSKFDIDYGLDVYLVGVSSTSKSGGYTKGCMTHGRYRKTEVLAEQAMKLNQQVNRLDELAKWLEPKWEANWNDDTPKSYIYYRNGNTFGYASNNSYKSIGTVYMSENTAVIICDALNNSELPELAEILKV